MSCKVEGKWEFKEEETVVGGVMLYEKEGGGDDEGCNYPNELLIVRPPWH